MSAGPMTSHLSDEDLLLEFYNEGTLDDRARVREHLAGCPQCRAADEELRVVLQAVETTPLTEPPSTFEREMWARIEPLLPVQRAGWAPRLPRALSFGLATAAGLILLVTAFPAGRLRDRPPDRTAAPIVEESLTSDRLLRAEVEDHLERSQRMLVELVNAGPDLSGTVDSDRTRAADLVAAGRLYRRSAEEVGNGDVGALLDDLERVLVEVANGEPRGEAAEMERLRQRVQDEDLLFRLRVVTQDMRQAQPLSTGVVLTSAR